ncbi:heterokaryon incompatibility protein-domain-containing protein, partial [Phaeosphaeria sp. MPI-PUGE-AT-0046c]
MRLLNSRDQTFGSFDGEAVPPYAILSHTWGDGEVTHQDMVAWIYERKGSRSFREKKGFLKIDLTCKQADHDGLDWVWIDTCNIDKTSSSELSEAINSMFQWYKNAAICYVYLEDISCDDLVSSEGTTRLMPEVLRSARWFSRGWTLQELLASEKMNLFCAVPGHSQWSFIGSKDSVSMYLATITGIDRAVLEEPDLLPTVSVARRMSWAARRETTRPEDIAYCLLGVFQVNMPLLYGEGANAFIRLQEEIIKTSEDESLFAWTPKPSLISNSQVNDGILASHPKAFSESSEIVPYASKLAPYNMTNRGLHI